MIVILKKYIDAACNSPNYKMLYKTIIIITIISFDLFVAEWWPLRTNCLHLTHIDLQISVKSCCGENSVFIWTENWFEKMHNNIIIYRCPHYWMWLCKRRDVLIASTNRIICTTLCLTNTELYIASIMTREITDILIITFHIQYWSYIRNQLKVDIIVYLSPGFWLVFFSEHDHFVNNCDLCNRSYYNHKKWHPLYTYYRIGYILLKELIPIQEMITETNYQSDYSGR